MKGWPLWETDPALPKRLKPGDWAIAFGLAWLGPAVIGAPLLMGTGYLIEAAGIDVLEVGMIGILLIYSPLFAWLGLLPGALLLRLALRRGVGGWAMALIIGLALGYGGVLFLLSTSTSTSTPTRSPTTTALATSTSTAPTASPNCNMSQEISRLVAVGMSG